MGVRHVGERVKRVEDPRLLTGGGRFVDDIRLPNMTEATFVRSSEAHACIKSIDISEALAVPGVIAVFTLKDFGPEFAQKRLPQPAPHPLLKFPSTQYPPARDEVCYVGECVAMVVAQNRYIAEDAASLVWIEYESLPAVTDLRAAAQPEAPLANKQLLGNIAASVPWRYGDCTEAFAVATHVFKESYVQHRGGGHSMECRGVVACHDAPTDLLTVWTSTQTPYMVRRFLAQYLGREESRTRVIAPDVGGGFGPKVVIYPEEYAVAFAAMEIGRPIKWIEDRRENFVATTQQRDIVWEMEVAADGNGKIVALRGHGYLDGGAYLPYGLVLAMTSLMPFPGPYAIPSMDVVLDVVLTNATPTSPVRGAGRPNVAFVLERLIDLVARRLDRDRAEVRRVNFVKKNEFPYATGAKLPNGVPVTYDSGDYEACLDKALRSEIYTDFEARRVMAREQGRYLGLGIASYNEDTGMGPFEGATVRVQSSGKVLIQTGAASQGQGLDTVLAQICADRLGVEPSDVSVESGDTAAFPLGIATVASRVAVAAGSSVYEAAELVRAKAIALASGLLEVSEEKLKLENGTVGVVGDSNKHTTLAELARRLAGSIGIPTPAGLSPGLEATAYHNITRPTYAGGTHIAEVEVDTDTGQVKVLNYFVAHDCGRLLNPMLVDGQIAGGVVHGIGNALLERMIYDDSGQPQTTNYGEYLLPTATEIPTIHIEHVETLSPLNPLGVKGAGEGGTIPAAAAIVSAIENALADREVRVCSYPVSPEMIVQLIDSRNS